MTASQWTVLVLHYNRIQTFLLWPTRIFPSWASPRKGFLLLKVSFWWPGILPQKWIGENASICPREGLDWILGRRRGWLKNGMDCSREGRGAVPIPEVFMGPRMWHHEGHGLAMGLSRSGYWLDLVILKAFSNLDDYMKLQLIYSYLVRLETATTLFCVMLDAGSSLVYLKVIQHEKFRLDQVSVT